MRLVLTSTKLKSLVMVVRKRLFYFRYEMPPNFQTFSLPMNMLYINNKFYTESHVHKIFCRLSNSIIPGIIQGVLYWTWPLTGM